MPSRLSPLQERILRVIARVDPQPVVTGGAALAGFYTSHRTTRDVDAFWRGRDSLGDLPRLVLDGLADAELSVSVVQRTRAFLRARITADKEVCLLDLVAEPVAAIAPPEYRMLGETQVAIDSAHEILVNKLCALLERSELRDLVDVKALVEAGGDLERALQDAPRKDGGFSMLTLAWVLETTPFEPLVAASDIEPAALEGVAEFRRSLIARLTAR